MPNIGALITSRDPSDYSNVDGAMIEGFAEWGGGNYFAESDWALQMNRILPLARADKALIAQTYPNPNDVQERLFILSSYLLIKGAHTYINLDTGLDSEWFPEYTTNLGEPIDPLPANISSYLNPLWDIYIRNYMGGLVLLNPTTFARTIRFGTTYYRVVPSGGGLVPDDGSAPGSLSYVATTSLTLAPHQAAILLNQAP